jgi:acyl carrier protein
MAGTDHKSGAAGPADRPSALHRATLEGSALMSELRYEAALLLHASADSLDPAMSLQAMGFDSLMLAQLSGTLSQEFRFRLRDEHLFSDSATLNWLVENAALFRRGELPVVVAGAGVQAASVELQTAEKPQACGIGTNVVTSAVTATGAEAQPRRVVESVSPGTMAEAAKHAGGRDGSLPGGRKKPGWFQQNCPCCTFCC